MMFCRSITHNITVNIKLRIHVLPKADDPPDENYLSPILTKMENISLELMTKGMISTVQLSTSHHMAFTSCTNAS